MSAALSKNTPKSYLHLGIMLAIMFIFRLPVPPEGLTAEGMAVIGIFFAVLYGWLFLDIVWPSLLGLVALGLAINEPMTEVIGSAFGNSTVLLILLFCMVASIINAAGIAEWMARKIISLPIVRGRPYMLILMLAAAMSVLATMLTMTAAVVVGFPLIKEVCKQYGYKPGDTFPVMLFVAMFYIAEVAFMMLPFKALPAVVFGVYSQLSDGHVINYTAYVGICAIQLVLAVLFMLFLFRFILRPDVSRIVNGSADMSFNESLNSYQKTILYSFCVLLVLLLLPNIAPADWAPAAFLNRLTTNGLLIAYIGFYLLLNFKEGINIKAIMSKSVAWPAIFLVISVLKITAAFSSTGVTHWLGELCKPLLQGYSEYALIFIVVVITTIATQLTNNTAVAATFAPIAYSLALANGSMDPQSILTCLTLTCTLGIATPAATAASAVLHGDTEWVKARMIFRYALPYWVFNIVMGTLITYNLCRIML